MHQRPSGSSAGSAEVLQRQAVQGQAAAKVGELLTGWRMQHETVEAAAADAQRLTDCRRGGGGRAGRGGRGGERGGGRRGRGGGDGRDLWQEREVSRLGPARRLQQAARQMLAKRRQEMAQQLREARAALVEAAAAHEVIVAAREKAEAGKEAAEAECRGLEAALVQLVAQAELASQRETRVGEAEGAAGTRRLAVVEETWHDVDAATQTEARAVVGVGSQTEAACATQVAGCEMVVGRQLHPAQAEAVARAERAAAQLERLRKQAEAAAARYQVTDDAAEVQSAEATAQKTAQVSKVATPTGGRQRRKQHVRRQAAAAGMDVLSWTASGRQQQGDAEVASQAEWQRALEQRLDVAHEQWMRRQRHASVGDERIGEAEASRRFWQAAQASGINLLDAPD